MFIVKVWIKWLFLKGEITVITDKLSREFSSKNGVVKALDSISITAKEGEILGILGPNGAGKTTLIRILSTLLLPTSGWARVTGYDVAKEPDRVRERINMASGAEKSGYDFITTRKNLWFFSQLYGIDNDVAKKRIEELASELSFAKYLDSKFYSLSTGYRQRVSIARAFINKPNVVFLDEPTVGLDVMTAISIRNFLKKKAREEKTTIILATHNMSEVEAICDKVAIIDRGKIIVEGKPKELKESFREVAYAVEIYPVPEDNKIEEIRGIKGYTVKADSEKGTATLNLIIEKDEEIEKICSEISERGFKILNRWRKEPTLEEVFVLYVGKGFRERENE
jgi:ABC-2 type transport system ATP-binding protein